MKLTKLFDCQYRSGRAASAPQTRTTPGTKLTMAEANMVEEEATFQGEKDPEMPHRFLQHSELERLHPALHVPHDPHQELDLNDDDADGIFVEGERIAREIMVEARLRGRRRDMREREPKVARQQSAAVVGRVEHAAWSGRRAVRPGNGGMRRTEWSGRRAARPGAEALEARGGQRRRLTRRN